MYKKCLFRHYLIGIIAFSLLIFFLLPPASVQAAAVTLAWDGNTEPDLAGYSIYVREGYAPSKTSYTRRIDVSLASLGGDTSSPQYTVSNVSDTRTTYFAVTARDSKGNESGLSNVVSYVPADSSRSDSSADDSNTFESSSTPMFWGYIGWDWQSSESNGDNSADSTSDSSADSADANTDSGSTEIPFEVGEVVVDSGWTWVSFQGYYNDPVVVAKPLSLNDEEPAVVRIRNVKGTGFEIMVQEWDYLDGVHEEEKVSYMVMERGSYILADGTVIEAGRFKVKNTKFVGVQFSSRFHQVPVVLTTVISFWGREAVTGRMRGITEQGFEFHLREQELNMQKHTAESISYIAWEPSMGSLNGIGFEVSRTGKTINHDFQNIQFLSGFSSPPLFLADIQTHEGGNTANLRWQNKSKLGIDIKVAEEQSLDPEVNHMAEVVGYMVFE
ncbi:MAG: hypothetical protein JRI89_17745 [Deltaproteobacteria bacterium]|nr:hypothetical protein [Deltaproteobacteria bacterium]